VPVAAGATDELVVDFFLLEPQAAIPSAVMAATNTAVSRLVDKVISLLSLDVGQVLAQHPAGSM
jgi:hypothetical protein